ncbi:L-lactate MFS transporter [Halocatena marina]|nr:OFA family MFS transporter [Halocatena marina]
METDKNRWLIALSAVAIHLSIGGVYAYSIYQNPLHSTVGWAVSDVTLAFTIAIFVLGLTAAFLGIFVEKYGPRRSGLTAASLYGLGTVGAGISVQMESLVLFLGTYGVIGGMGLGIGYISPISTLVEWFPDRRGMATGLAVMGFGAGALVTGPVGNYLIQTFSIPVAFYVLGIGYFVLMSAGASYLQKPPDGWLPDSMDETDLEEESSDGVSASTDLEELTAREARKTPRFYLLWLIIFINVSAGIMLLAFASPMLQSIGGATATTAAFIVGYIGLFNGGGRIFWASISDYIGRTTTYAIFFAIQILVFFLMPQISGAWILAGLLFLIITCYGGGFACLPAYIGDLFGTKELGAIHGYSLTAWGVAGVAGPTLASTILETTGSYTTALYIINIALIVGLVCVGLLRWRIQSVRSAQETPTTSPLD